VADAHVYIGMKSEHDRTHVYPMWGRVHVLDGTECWCRPELQKPCGQCDGEDGCWSCDGTGWVEAVGAEALLVIHRSEGER